MTDFDRHSTWNTSDQALRFNAEVANVERTRSMRQITQVVLPKATGQLEDIGEIVSFNIFICTHTFIYSLACLLKHNKLGVA